MKKLFILFIVIISSCAKEISQEDNYCTCVEQVQRRGNTQGFPWANLEQRNTYTSYSCDRNGDITQQWSESPPNSSIKTYYRVILKCN